MGRTEPSRENEAMPRMVLLVEDSEQSASTLEIALASLPGVGVLIASTGQDAWNALHGAVISAIITDLNMPRMDGFELIRRVRANLDFAHLPIIVVSGDTDPRTPERIQRLGANAYFAKPYSPAQVRKKLEQLLNAHPTNTS